MVFFIYFFKICLLLHRDTNGRLLKWDIGPYLWSLWLMCHVSIKVACLLSLLWWEKLASSWFSCRPSRATRYFDVHGSFGKPFMRISSRNSLISWSNLGCCSFFLILGSCNAICWNIFLRFSSSSYWQQACCQSSPDGLPGSQCCIVLCIASNLKSGPSLVFGTPDVLIDQLSRNSWPTSSGTLARVKAKLISSSL